MKNNDIRFREYANKNNIYKDIHLKITPLLLKRYIKKNYKNINFKDIIAYQGKLIDLKTISKYVKNNLIYFGNHLYEHWSSKKITNNHFKELFDQNNKLFKKNFKKKLNFFAFPHGIPKKTFTKAQKKFVVKKNEISFYSSGGDNFHKTKFLNRICVSRHCIENNILYYLFFRNLFKY